MYSALPSLSNFGFGSTHFPLKPSTTTAVAGFIRKIGPTPCRQSPNSHERYSCKTERVSKARFLLSTNRSQKDRNLMTRIVGSLVLAVVAFFVTSNMTQSMLSGGSDSKADSTSQKRGRLPSSLQKSIDKSNANLQRQLQAVQQYSQQSQMRGLSLARGKKYARRFYGNSYTSRSTPANMAKNSDSKPAKMGDVSSNPFAD